MNNGTSTYIPIAINSLPDIDHTDLLSHHIKTTLAVKHNKPITLEAFRKITLILYNICPRPAFHLCMMPLSKHHPFHKTVIR